MRNDRPHIRVYLIRGANGINYTRCKDCGEDNAWEKKETTNA